MTAIGAQAQYVVAIGGFMHESNSFNPAVTTLADFKVEEAGASKDLL
jgi:hypothetical protein